MSWMRTSFDKKKPITFSFNSIDISVCSISKFSFIPSFHKFSSLQRFYDQCRLQNNDLFLHWKKMNKAWGVRTETKEGETEDMVKRRTNQKLERKWLLRAAEQTTFHHLFNKKNIHFWNRHCRENSLYRI